MGTTLRKEKFFKHGFPKAYKIVPKEFKKIVDYLNNLSYQEEPDYKFIDDALKAICKDNHINPAKKLDWIGKLKKKPEVSEDEETSSDNKRSGSNSSDSGEKKKTRKKPSENRK